MEVNPNSTGEKFMTTEATRDRININAADHPAIEPAAPAEAPHAAAPAPVHSPTDVFKDLAALRKASVITVKRRVVLPPVKVVYKLNSSMYFRIDPRADMTISA
jgi:hypothetical protein